LLLFYITDRTQFPGDEGARQRALLSKIAEAARGGVDFIQLREKDLSGRELEALAGAVLRAVRENSSSRTENVGPATRLLINSRSDIAIACGADGMHLRTDDISPVDVRKIWAQAGQTSPPLISISCHSANEVARAGLEGADFAVFAPVFEKKDAPRSRLAGLAELRDACQQKVSVVALGGITVENARACCDAGAAGIAAIRLFQEHDIAEVVRTLRG
jgi:thiamine-phosphate pyrophosphorylase